MDLLAKYQAPFPLASEEGIPPYYKEVRWPFTGQAAAALPLSRPPTNRKQKKNVHNDDKNKKYTQKISHDKTKLSKKES